MILASTSIRRKEILESIIDDFEVISPKFDENNLTITSPYKYVLSSAINKNKSILKDNEIIISADTIICFNKKIIGKPKDKIDAFNMLSSLSNNTHLVYSAYVISKNLKIIIKRVSIAKVYIYPLNKDEINKYIDSSLPLDKAGSYGIQDKEYIKTKIIRGNYYTIMGLDKDKLIKDLRYISKNINN